MHLNYKRYKEKAEADRQLVLAYKNFFASESGRTVFSDLANRFHLLNATPTDPNLKDRAEGARNVILHILQKTNTDLVQLEKILSGDFSSITGEQKNE